MKVGIRAVVAVLAFSSLASAGTSSSGGLIVPETSVACHIDDGAGNALDVNIDMDPSSGEYSAVVQPSSLDALYEPVLFPAVARTQPSDELIAYAAEGFAMEIDLTTGLGAIPPQYEAKLTTAGDSGDETVVLLCVLNP